MSLWTPKAYLEERQGTIDTFYSGSGLVLPEYRRPPGSEPGMPGQGETAPLYPLQLISEDAITSRLHEVGRSLRVIEHDHNTFEIATIQAAENTDEYMLHISTYGSAITTNVSNGVEFAAQAARYPDKNHIYVASFGNGGTAPIRNRAGQREYVRKTGRFTWEWDGKVMPIPDLENLLQALHHEGITITRIMGTDSAGGNYAMALGVGMEPGQLSHALFSERSGFVDLSRRQIIGGIAIREQFLNAAQNRKRSDDRGAVTKEQQERARKIFAQYDELPSRQRLKAAKVGLAATARSMRTSMEALRRGAGERSDPLLSDANALHSRQPGSHITYSLADQDPLYQDPDKTVRAIEHFLTNLDTSDADVRAVVVKGMTHAWHTYFPNPYHALKQYALTL